MNRKNMGITIFILVFLSLIILLFKLWNAGYFDQKKINNHHLIGKTIKFSRPIAYIQRKSPVEGVKVVYIVPIVRAIKKEIVGLHNKDDTNELINVYIPSDTKFTIEEVYEYDNFVSSPTLYYVLSHNGIRYTISDFGFHYYQEAVNKNTQIPTHELDYLNKVKPDGTLTIKFYPVHKKDRYYDVFNLFVFEQCEAQNIVRTNDSITATVNFDQLTCLYNELLDHHLSDIYPVKYEIVK